jgi:hypothetical protein
MQACSAGVSAAGSVGRAELWMGRGVLVGASMLLLLLLLI